ncbi:MAG: tetratricopeptide repeat protein [Novosphingobium sp.]|uniref:tetratricopeptide repeat protein n=1 Tax=Novosphingobium sp. TaxID=1874826 RepID=UPI0017E595F9|nr:tetratricopeptide repeat protein [Novosphingobium sp.]
MKTLTWGKGTVVASLALALAAPALAQSADGATDTRLRALEAEVRALQRTVFPGADGKFFPPQVQPGQSVAPAAGTPASTPMSDMLTRMDAVEAQLARLTAQGEENANRIAKLEAQLGSAAPAAASGTAAAPDATKTGATTNSNLSAMTSGASAPKPAASAPAATSKPAPAAPAAAKPTSPTAQRLAAVKAVQKPATADAGDDEYSYGFRLWEAKFYPEAQQQLKLFLQKYPKHARISYARNLLGRAYLDEGNPREAASWFLQNYQAKAPRDRAPDSLLMLAESMRLLKDTNRACVALTQFGQEFPGEAAGRLKGQYDSTRGGLKCPAA